MELKREKGHCAELQSRISTTRNSLDIANHNVSSLEAEVYCKRNLCTCDHCRSSFS